MCLTSTITFIGWEKPHSSLYIVNLQINRSPSIIREEGCEEYEDQSSNINDKFFVQPDLPSLTNEQREHIIKVVVLKNQIFKKAI